VDLWTCLSTIEGHPSMIFTSKSGSLDVIIIIITCISLIYNNLNLFKLFVKQPVERRQ